MDALLDLSIDESGTSHISGDKYRFFLVSAVLMSPREKELANLLFQKWRKKYLTNPDRCFHAVDFFEEKTPYYKKPELRMSRNFQSSIDDLLVLLKMLELRANVYYIDLPKLRAHMGIPVPPKLRTNKPIPSDEYKKLKKEYQANITKTLGKEKPFAPLSLTLLRAFEFHSEVMRGDQLLSTKKGYIDFESQHDADPQLIKIFHKHKEVLKGTGYSFGDNILGIRLHTKGSLDVGIELADLVAYVTYQNLRYIHKLKNEQLGIQKNYHQHIRKIWNILKKYHKINYIEVSNDYLSSHAQKKLAF